MEPFGYLSVLISIILGLALTRLLTGAGQLIRSRERVRFYAPTAIWMAVLFIVIVQSWWTMFSLRSHIDWTIVQFSIVLMHPTLLYLLVELIVPDASAEGVFDLKPNYFRQAPVFFASVIAVIAFSLLRPVALYGALADPLDVAIQLVFALLSAVAIFWRNGAYHWSLAPLFALFEVFYVAALFVELR